MNLEAMRGVFSRRNAPAFSLAAALLLLAADLLIMPTAPSHWQLVRYGLLGALVQPLLVLAAAVALASRKRDEDYTPLFTYAVIGLLATPMISVDEFVFPLLHLVRWAAGGSPLAVRTLVLTALPLSLLVALLLFQPFAWVRKWLCIVLAVVVASLPVIHSAFLPVGPARLLISGALHAAALGLAWYGWRTVGSGLLEPLVDIDLANRPSRTFLEAAVLTLVLLLYLALKLETVSYSATDENIYFYAAKLFAAGKMPYRDFFFAHPPLHVMIPGLLSLAVGNHFVLLKLVSVAASIASGLFLYLTARRAGLMAALATIGLFLFAHEQLQASTNLTGINLTVMFLCAAAWLAANRYPLAAGIVAGLSTLAGVYSAGPALGLSLLFFWLGWRPGLVYLGGLAGAAVGGHLLFWLLFRTRYVEQVFTYHFLKPSKVEGYLPTTGLDLALLVALGLGLLAGVAAASHWWQGRDEEANVVDLLRLDRTFRVLCGTCVALLLLGATGSLITAEPAGFRVLWHDFKLFVVGKEFLRHFFFHPHLILAPACALLSLVGAGAVRHWLVHDLEPPSRSFGIALTIGGALFASAFSELALLRETYTFYYVIALPGAALLCGTSWAMVGQVGLSSPYPAQADKVGERAGAASRRFLALLAVLALLAANTAFVPISLKVGERRFPEEREQAGTWTCYDVKNNVSTPLSSLVRSHLLTSCRIKGSVEPGIYHYLWKKKWYFSRAQEIADYIRDNSAPGETIVGSSLTTPLLSMLSGRALAADFVDTNSKRFKSGMLENKHGCKEVHRTNPNLSEAKCRRIAAEREMWEKVCRTPVRFVVSGPSSFFTPERMRRHPLIRTFFRPAKLFNEPHLKMSGKYPIVLFRRVADSPDRGRYCQF